MHCTRRTLNVARPLAVVFLAAAVSACDVVVNSLDVKGRAQDQWTRSYAIAQNGDVEIVNANGAIDVTGEDGARMEVVAERTARAMTDDDARKVLAQLTIVEDVSARRVRLETKAPSGEGRRVDVKYHVKVPASANLRLVMTNGAVDVANVKGTVRVETSNGRVRGRELAGAVEASTTNGSVRLEVTRVAADGVRAETVNGAVEVVLPSDAKADVRATCLNGRISVNGLKLDGPETTRRRVEGRLNGGGPKVVADTTNGSIHITGK